MDPPGLTTSKQEYGREVDRVKSGNGHGTGLKASGSGESSMRLSIGYTPIDKPEQLARLAFLEMGDENAATTMVQYFTTCTAQLRGRVVYVQFSNHKELKTDQTHSNASASAQAALQAAQALSGTNETQGGPNTVLRVIIEHMVYPITLEVLYQSLDGQNVYNSCCTLRIEYSKLTNLNVKYNNDKSRDYTNPSLPNGESGLDGVIPDQLLPQLLLTGTNSPVALQAARRSLSQSDHTRISAPGMLASPFTPLALNSPLAASYAGSPVSGLPIGGFTLPGTGANSALGAGPLRLASQVPGTCVLLISVYGDVLRVKILYNKKDSALIQMAEPAQAHLAMTHMDKLRLFGKQMRVMPSKHQIVQMPKEGQPDAGLTKDYTNSPLHRFKKPGSKNYQNIYPPSATLHLSNIPASVSEEEMKQAFEETGFTVKGFKFFPKDRRMALIQLGSVDEAVSALVLVPHVALVIPPFSPLDDVIYKLIKKK
nr:PREDICTED: polypyrimidine tract-binding protein 1-like [Bemisia tabaci]